MPIYEYECQSCGLRFEKMRKLSDSDSPASCPECSAPETRKLMSSVNHSFAHVPVGGPRPQNTGVHSIDYSADRVIGRDAEQRWKTIAERQSHKRGVIRANPGATGFDLSRTYDGDYRVMAPPERKAVETARGVHKKVMDAIEGTTKAKKGQQ